MELPARPHDDQLLIAGEFTNIRRRLRSIAARHDLTCVIVHCFDPRTRMLPFLFADTRMAPAGVRSIAASLYDSGFTKTRIVLQQWNKRFSPSAMCLDGRVPDLLLLSSMHIHSAQCRRLIEDAYLIGPVNRPLVIVGGPKAIYEPADLFSGDPARPAGADVAVTGEDYVLLSLLAMTLSHRATGESVRSAFFRARDEGALADIPGLVYARTGSAGQAEELVNTGPQRLLGDLDELPDPVTGYLLIEPPSRRATLAGSPIPASHVRRLSPLSSILMTAGCKFSCPYCPIPAYNQRTLRFKSAQRIADEISRLYDTLGLRYFFGTDDNFFNDRGRSLEIAEALAAKESNCIRLRSRIRWGTEATVHDTVNMGDNLRTFRKAGLRALWLGVEDMSGSLVRKGQTAGRTLEAFGLLQRHGIHPMAMLMHHDAQPLYSRGGTAGLINQVHILRKAGAVSLQVLMITPAPGSKSYEGTFNSGMVIHEAGRRPTEPHMFDGNYVVASRSHRPWRKQWNILAAYLWFYNPLRFAVSLVRPKSHLYLVDPGMQIFGMLGLLQTARRTVPWALRLMLRTVRYHDQPPRSAVPVIGIDGSAATRFRATAKDCGNSMTAGSIENTARALLDGRQMSRSEALALTDLNQSDTGELLHWACRIRERCFGRRVSFCCIAPGRLGGCDQDCAWCGQSARHTSPVSEAQQPDLGQWLEAARKARQSHATCFCMVNPGRRPRDEDLQSLERLNEKLKLEGLPPACASLGELDAPTAMRLRAASVVRYNHNLETSRSHFGRVVTTHSYDDRLSTLQAARAAGMALCCGGIFGIGETWDDRIELAFTLRDHVKPDVVPLNFLDARPGTPMASAKALSPLECLRIIALFRFVLPTTNIKIAGGRRMLRDLQSWVFHAGASSLMVGDYLTTTGRDAEMDIQMVMDLGLELVDGHKEPPC
ncbi:MAG: biotin synthase BioB [Phycisphaerae bacterium]|nr:biotin synthase BioB [Phycisphaerae bacterium]